jgi:hypothetical protein
MEHPDRHQPHAFAEVDELPMTQAAEPLGRGGGFLSPPVPMRKSSLCAICHMPKGDRIHIEGEAEADAESPTWG